MESKSDLQIINEMWQTDCLNCAKDITDALVIFSGSVGGARTVSAGGIIEMGVSQEAVVDLLTRNNRFYLLLGVDRNEFKKRKEAMENQQPAESTFTPDEQVAEKFLQIKYWTDSVPAHWVKTVAEYAEVKQKAVNEAVEVFEAILEDRVTMEDLKAEARVFLELVTGKEAGSDGE